MVRRKGMAIDEWETKGDKEGKITCLGYGQGLGSALDLIMVKLSENLEIPNWLKELRVTAQESSNHLPVKCKVEWKEKTKNNSR